MANKKIIITRGKDTGHNGRPIFLGSDTKNCAIIDVNYVELNNLVFQNGGINGGCVIGILGGMEVDIFNCEIWHPRTIGILVEASNARVMYNTIKTGMVSNSYGTDGMWVSGGASFPTETGSGIYGNIEIAYNYFLMQNSSGTGHKDAVQLTMRWQENDGLTKIHHNYMGAITSTPSTNADLIYVDDGAAGHYEIYNNIFVQKNFIDGGGYVNFIGDQTEFRCLDKGLQ